MAVTAFIAYTLGGFFIVPLIVEHVIKKQSASLLGRQAVVENVRCNPFTLSLTLEGFTLSDRPGSVLAAFDSLYANAQVSSIFHWAATLKEVRITRPSLAFRRFSDGKVNLLEVFDSFERNTGATDGFDLPRAILQTIIIDDGKLLIEDHHREHPLLWNWNPVDFTLNDISTLLDDRGDNAGTIKLPGGGTIAASGSVVLEPFGLDGLVTLKGINLKGAWQAVDELLDFDLTNGSLDTDFHYRLALLEDGLYLNVTDLNAGISDLAFSAETFGGDLLDVQSISATNISASWPEQVIHGQSVVVSGASIFGRLSPEKTLIWAELVPEETRKVVAETYEALKDRIHINASLDRFEVHDSSAVFEDQVQDPPVHYEATGTKLVVTDISTDRGSAWPFEAKTTLFGQATATAKGAFTAHPVDLQAAVGVDSLDLRRFQPYFEYFAPIDLQAGSLSTHGQVSVSSTSDGLGASFQGSLDITDLDLKETLTGDKLLSLNDMAIDGVNAQLLPMSLDVTSVDINGAGLDITIAKDDSINLLEFFKALSRRDELARLTGSSGPGGLPPTSLARLRLHDCYGRFTDTTIEEEFALKIVKVNGTISGISTESRAGAEVDVDAEIDTGGVVRVGGQIAPFNFTRLTDLTVDVNDVVLPPMSPMAVKFIGHPIAAGEASLDLKIDITKAELVSFNTITADGLELGERVEGDRILNLPFKLGVSLLKDRHGHITVDVPFEGNIEDQDFGLGPALTAAIHAVISNIVSSPFRLLSKIGGSGSEDLEHVEFRAGSAVLDDRATSNLQILATAMGERPTLQLEIHGVVDIRADTQGLQQKALNNELLQNGVTDEQIDTVIRLDILTRLYRNHFSGEELKALTATHTPPGDELDEIAFRQAVTRALTEAQTVDPAEVQALGPARAQAIRQFLVEQAHLDAGRVTIEPETETQESGGSHAICLLVIEAGQGHTPEESEKTMKTSG